MTTSAGAKANTPFARDGFAIAPSFLEPAELDSLRDASAKLEPDQLHLRALDPLQRVLMEPAFDGSWDERIFQLSGERVCTPLGVQLVRRPSTHGVKPHRDGSYFPNRPVLCLWLALEPASPVNGCLQIKNSAEWMPVDLPSGGAILFDGQVLHRSSAPANPVPTRLSLITHFEHV